MPSGTPIRRPQGQILRPREKLPSLASCDKLDLELELGMFVCKESLLEYPILVSTAEEYIFGYVLMNEQFFHSMRGAGGG